MSGMQESELESAVQAIVEAAHPEAVLLFGSRARGDYCQDSDWDLFVILPDEVRAGAFTPSKLRRAAQSRARLPLQIIACRRSIFLRQRANPNSLSHDAVRDGVLLYGKLPP